MINPKSKSFQFLKPGHVFPLIAKEGGVLRRTGHTEAAIDFARLAGMKPAGVIVEIMNDDGTMARLPDLKKIAKKFNLKIVTIEDLVAYRMQHDSLILKRQDTEIETKFGNTYYKLTKKRFNNYTDPQYYRPNPNVQDYEKANIFRYFVAYSRTNPPA